MQIKTDNGTQSVASNGLGVWGAVGGGLGTLALANQILGGGNGILGLNGNCQNVPNQCQDTRTISALQSELSKEKAERYADGIGISTFKEAQVMNDKTNERLLSLEKFAYELDKQNAVEHQAVNDNFRFLNYKIDKTKDDVMCYVNGTFVAGKLVMPKDSICPSVMPEFNSWTAPTTTAPATGA